MISKPVEVVHSEDDKVERLCPNGTDKIVHKELNGRLGNVEVVRADANGREGNISAVSMEGCSHDEYKKANQRRELTLEDICNNPNDLEDDDDDDSDWDPLLEHLAIRKWFCTNCTMVNLDGMLFCEACKEHKQSGILEHGFFGSPTSQAAALTQVESDVLKRYTESVSNIAAAGCYTAIGFDERMLLHSEVVMKSHPHPERPDRLRAIAASLSKAGIFPGKCRPIAAREITKEELLKVHSVEHIEAVEHTEKMLSSYFTPDTYANEHSAEAARLAAGLCADLAAEIYSGRVKNGFALIRPPGHHAGVHTDSAKVKWGLDCVNGMRKTYWINCNVEPDIQHLSLDRGRLPSNFVVRPRDLTRLLSNFQSSLHEITIIATEPSSLPSEAESQIGGKAVELRSYIDPTNDSGSSLHTQLWIDPVEEFLQYVHTGNPVDVTVGVKELKAFLSFCEACEVDIHFFFEKAGEPILMTPKFGLDDDGSTSNFDAKLVLATMLTSQLHIGNPTGPIPSNDAVNERANDETVPEAEQQRSKVQASFPASEHTKIWSDLSASAAKSGGGNGSRQVQGQGNTISNEQGEIQRFNAMKISKGPPEKENIPDGPNVSHMETDQGLGHHGLQDMREGFSQRHPSNWVDADDEDDDEEDDEMCVQSTPPYCEEQ